MAVVVIFGLGFATGFGMGFCSGSSVDSGSAEAGAGRRGSARSASDEMMFVFTILPAPWRDGITMSIQ